MLFRSVVRAGAPTGDLTERYTAFMRYHGQGHEIEIALPARDLTKDDLVPLRAAFEDEYARQFSRTLPDMAIEILNWALTLSAPVPSAEISEITVETALPSLSREILCDVTSTHRNAVVHDRATLAPATTRTPPFGADP